MSLTAVVIKRCAALCATEKRIGAAWRRGIFLTCARSGSNPANAPGQFTGIGIGFQKVGNAEAYTITDVVPGVINQTLSRGKT